MMQHIIQRMWTDTCNKVKYVAYNFRVSLRGLHLPKKSWRVATKNLIACLHWYSEYWVERLGKLGLFMIGLIIFLLSYATLIVWPSQQALFKQVNQQKLNIATLKLSSKLNITKDDAHQEGTIELLESRKWPVAAQLLQSGLIIHEASYVKEPVVNNKLQRLNLELVLSGSYPDLIQALTTLRTDPLLRLEFLQLERTGPETSMTRIRLRLSTLGML